MPLLYFFEGLRRPWLDSLMLALTQLGDETAFLALALILFWCVDKRKGYYLMAVGILSTIASQFLKILCRIPRPWVRDPQFTIVEAARSGAGGYSFPSGHSQASVGTFGSIAMTTRSRLVRWGCVALCVLVPLSRMYLGVHTPQDVLVGSGLSVLLLLVMRPVVLSLHDAKLPKLFLLFTALAVVYVLYLECYPFPADIDAENLASARKNAYTLLGSIAAMAVVCRADQAHPFTTEAALPIQVLKAVGGIALVLLLQQGLRWPLDTLFSGHLIARSVRYAIMVLFAGILWPKSFPLLTRLYPRKAGGQHSKGAQAQ